MVKRGLMVGAVLFVALAGLVGWGMNSAGRQADEATRVAEGVLRDMCPGDEWYYEAYRRASSKQRQQELSDPAVLKARRSEFERVGKKVGGLRNLELTKLNLRTTESTVVCEMSFHAEFERKSGEVIVVAFKQDGEWVLDGLLLN